MAYISWAENASLQANELKNKMRVSNAKIARDSRIATSKYQLDDIAKKLALNSSNYSKAVNAINALAKQHDAELEKMNIEFGREIGRMNLNFNKKISSLSDNIRILENDQKKLEQEITHLAAEYDKLLAEIVEKRNGKEERANFICNQYKNILDKINYLHPQYFDNDKNEIISKGYEDVRNDIAAGLYDSAIGLAQKNITIANQLYVKLIVLNKQFDELSNLVNEKLETLAYRLDKAEQSTNSEEEVNIPYWSNGIFDNIKEQFLNTRKGISVALSNYDINSLQEYLIIVDNLLEQFDSCIEFSVREKNRSDAILDTANTLTDTLHKKTNFAVLFDESAFIDNNDKKPFSLKLENGAGNIINFLIYSPDKNEKELGVSIIFKAETEDVACRNTIEQSVIEDTKKENIIVTQINDDDSLKAGLTESDNSQTIRRDELIQRMREKQEEDLKNVDKLRA